MTIKQFIEEAIEGGYRDIHGTHFTSFKRVHDSNLFDLIDSHEGGTSVRTHALEEILLDPLAWRAVEKVEGWKHEMQEMEHVGAGGQVVRYRKHRAGERLKPAWLLKWHRMIDALAEGKTIEQFLETL